MLDDALGAGGELCGWSVGLRAVEHGCCDLGVWNGSKGVESGFFDFVGDSGGCVSIMRRFFVMLSLDGRWRTEAHGECVPKELALVQ